MGFRPPEAVSQPPPTTKPLRSKCFTCGEEGAGIHAPADCPSLLAAPETANGRPVWTNVHGRRKLAQGAFLCYWCHKQGVDVWNEHKASECAKKKEVKEEKKAAGAGN